MINEFKKWLKKQDFSPATKYNYLFTVKQFANRFGTEITREKLLKYKAWLVDSFSPKTVNVRLNGINCYLRSIKKQKWCLEGVKVQNKTFQENIISEADYEFLKKKLKRKGDYQGYFLIRFLGATGARISEFCQLKVEHVHIGYFDMYGKGKKYRRIYIPYKLQKEALEWLENENRDCGFLFINKNGTPFNPGMVTKRLKFYANKYGINPEVMYPHSFRHRFAKNFIKKDRDIALLADLMGHESIETTRIYLRMTVTEQREIVDRIITW